MKVSELMDLLKKCPQDSIVMYDIENELYNEGIKIIFDDHYQGLYPEKHFSIDDALVCSGTLKGFVYLIADRLDKDDTVIPFIDIDEAKCPVCKVKLTRQELLGEGVLFEDFYDYCPRCGRKVKW